MYALVFICMAGNLIHALPAALRSWCNLENCLHLMPILHVSLGITSTVVMIPAGTRIRMVIANLIYDM